MKLTGIGCGSLIGLLVLAAIGGMVMNSMRSPEEKAARQEQRERADRLEKARISVYGYVKSKMRSPSTAVVEIRDAGYGVDGKIRMVGHVDAQNGFGATVRNEWIIEMSPKGEDWNVDSFHLVE